MNTCEMIKELKCVQSKEEGKTYGTFETRWFDLLGDVIQKLEELERKAKLFDALEGTTCVLSEAFDEMRKLAEIGRATEKAFEEGFKIVSSKIVTYDGKDPKIYSGETIEILDVEFENICELLEWAKEEEE